MKTIQEQIAVMQHFAEGGELEFSSGVNWLGCTVPSWNWQTFDYRIKQPVDPYAELKTAAACCAEGGTGSGQAGSRAAHP